MLIWWKQLSEDLNLNGEVHWKKMCACQQAQKRLNHNSEVTGALCCMQVNILIWALTSVTCELAVHMLPLPPQDLCQSTLAAGKYASSQLLIANSEKNWYASKDICLRPWNMLSQIAAFSMAFPECSVPTFRRWTFSAISLLSTNCTPASRRGFFEFK